MEPKLEKRTHVYAQRPATFEISGCPDCGNTDPDWSEYKGHLWCQKCNKDFVPASNGVFDGPINIQVCELIGVYFDQIRISDGVIEPDPLGKLHFKRAVPLLHRAGEGKA